MVLEWLALLLLAGVAAWLWYRAARSEGRASLVLAASVVGLFGLGTVSGAAIFAGRVRSQGDARAAVAARVPDEGRPGGYVTSDACRGCHPAEHASWHRSFHRTMTQLASPATVLAPFEGVPPLRVKTGQLELSRRDESFWVRFVPSPGAGAARDYRVGLLTGSHHMQVYWVNAGALPGEPDPGNRLEMFPYAYLIGDRRWVPARDTFLADPEIEWNFDVWNTQCLQCHVTAGQPRSKDGGRTMASRVGEIGIGCESCHGPGEQHIETMHNPVRRYAAHLRSAGPDPLAIVNPARLSARASSEVCGQCHGYFAVPDPDAFLREGSSYLPGEPLEPKKPTLHRDVPASAKYLAAARANNPHFEDSLYWSDGAVRVTGREWTALRGSTCHLRGGLSCLSCHSMHRSEPDDQLAAGREGNQACLGCHRELQDTLAAHTHHPAESTGSLCYNCHMPYTTYGLLKAVRSHTIDSPRVATHLQTGRPNACNQCHLDRTLEWAATHLRDWYGQPSPALDAESRSTAAAVIAAVKGDAGQRALVAWSMGWDAARAASGTGWMTPYLVLALGDPYSAVRYIAEKSLRKSPGLEDVVYDYAAPGEEIERQVDAVMARWAPRRQREGDPERAARLLLRPDGSLVTDKVEELLGRRDGRSLELRE